MNKKLIAAAVSAAVVAPVAAQAEVSVYGRINNAIDINDLDDSEGADSTTDISTVASRFGVRYNQEIGSGYSAHGQYEFSTTTDKEKGTDGAVNNEDGDATGDTVSTSGGVEDVRVATVGLSGPFGRIDVGNQWSAYNQTFGTLVSPTYSLGFYLYSGVGGGLYRASNTIKYSNTFGPVNAVLDVRLNDSDTSDTAETARGDGIGLGLSFAVTDNITIAAAWDSEDGADGNTGFDEGTAPAAGVATTLVQADFAAIDGVTDAQATEYFAFADIADGPTADQQRIDYIAALIADEEARADAVEAGGAANDQRFTAADFTGYMASENGTPAHSDANDDPDADRFGIALSWSGGGYWVNVGWQNYSLDDDENTPADDEVDVDTTFLYGGGSFSETTSWMLGYAEGDDGADAVSRVYPLLDADATAAGNQPRFGVNASDETDDSSQFLWAVYHNLGGGLRLYYEAIAVDSENNTQDGARHLLGMRVDF